MLTVYLVRHGQTEWNREMRFQGHLDSALSDLGRKQAEQVGLRLKSETIQAVWSSDLSRASETAAAIASHHGLPVHTTPGLREQSHGKWEGMNEAEIRTAGFGDLYSAYRLDSRSNHPPEGETLQAVYRRCSKAFAQIAAQYDEGSIVMVGHTGSVRAILCHILGAGTAGMRRIMLDNASLNIAENPGDRFRIRLINDTSHLAGLVVQQSGDSIHL